MHSSSARPLPPPPPPEPLSLLLAQWGAAPAAPAPVTERLGSWLGWTEAIGLSQVLSAVPGGTSSESARLEAVKWALAALDKLRATLAEGSSSAELAVDSNEAPAGGEPPPDQLALYLQYFAQQQHSYASRVAPLRHQLRDCMEQASGELGHVAQLDRFFERAIADPERLALATLAEQLVKRAKHHYVINPRRWRSQLWSDLQRLLRADLDQRLQPVLGLIEALSTPKFP